MKSWNIINSEFYSWNNFSWIKKKKKIGVRHVHVMLIFKVFVFEIITPKKAAIYQQYCNHKFKVKTFKIFYYSVSFIVKSNFQFQMKINLANQICVGSHFCCSDNINLKREKYIYIYIQQLSNLSALSTLKRQRAKKHNINP